MFTYLFTNHNNVSITSKVLAGRRQLQADYHNMLQHLGWSDNYTIYVIYIATRSTRVIPLWQTRKTQTHILKYSNALTHSHTHILKYSNIYSHTLTYSNALTHTHTHITQRDKCRQLGFKAATRRVSLEATASIGSLTSWVRDCTTMETSAHVRHARAHTHTQR